MANIELPPWKTMRELRAKYPFHKMKIGETMIVGESEENFRRVITTAYSLPAMQFETHWKKTYGEVIRIVRKSISRRKDRLNY